MKQISNKKFKTSSSKQKKIEVAINILEESIQSNTQYLSGNYVRTDSELDESQEQIEAAQYAISQLKRI
jgi:uncharacterized UBP type Zn finger protein